MNILFFSDIHAKMFGSIPMWNRINKNGTTEEMNRFINSFKFIENSISEIKPDLVVFLGDIFHSLYSIDVITLVNTVKCMNMIYEVSKDIGSEFWIIPGNHDIRSNGIYSTEIFKCDKFFNSQTIFEYKDFKFGIVPYSDPEYLMAEQINKFSVKSDIIFTHALFKGGIQNKSDFGFSPSIGLPVISGHVHIPKVVGDVFYVGSAHQINPSEECSQIKHGIMTYDLDSNKVKRYYNNNVRGISVIYGSNKSSIDKLELSIHENKFIKLVVTDNDFSKIESLLDGLDYMVVKIPEKQREKKFENLEMKSPADLIKDFFENNYSELYDDVNSILVECE